ncbi:hypothetical protein V865_002672 [Kwoniella europaea PYCC6329]|uniref:DUS-like FMN-binding domain-containing protein n=1 Tax=Kwoniella europaea PYCC6329 TaxID=1423913 RepID=A0AAX4KDD7_9TREE
MAVATARSPSPAGDVREVKRLKTDHTSTPSQQAQSQSTPITSDDAQPDVSADANQPNEAELVEEQMSLPIEFPKTYENELNYRDKLVLAPMVRTGTSVTGVITYHKGQGPIFSTHPIEKPYLIFQIGSSDPELAVKAAQIVQQDVSGIDLNCGCPKPFSTRDMRPAERALWERLADIVALGKRRGLPVICNGDGDGWANWEKIRTETNADSVMLARAAERNPSVFLPTGPVCNMTEVVPKLLAIAKHTNNPWGNTKFLLTQFKASPPPISNMSKHDRKQAAEIVSKSKTIEQVAEGLKIPIDNVKEVFDAIVKKIRERDRANTNIWEERHEAEVNGQVVDESATVDGEAEVDGFEVGVGQAQS